MAQQINVKTQTLRDTAQHVRNQNNRLDEILANSRNKVTALENSWESDAGREIRAKINAFANNHFEAYKSIVESYAAHLIRTAEKYEVTEETAERNASAFTE